VIRFHAHPEVWLLIAAFACWYEWALRRVGPGVVHPIERVVTRKQVALFASGLGTLWLAADWPVHDLAERYLFSVHMVQHLLISLVAVPLLMVGTPDWLWRWLLQPRPVKAAARFFGRPIIGLIFFNGVVAFTHAPVIVNLAVHNELAHFGLHALLFTSAVCMWMPVLNPLIELRRLTYPGRMLYLFVMSLLPTVPASFLTFGHTVLYPYYATVPRLWGMSALTDQLVAGLLMKLGGGAILWGFMSWYFFKWATAEQREGVDVVELGRLERELHRAGRGMSTP
jgi:putative membrane protein